MRSLLKRWWAWAGMLFPVIAIFASYLLIPIEEPRISQKNCDKIQKGWSPEQVEELLGKSSFEINIFRSGSDVDILFHKDGTLYQPVMLWIDDDGNRIQVFFEHPGRVTAKFYVASQLTVVESVKRRIDRRFKTLWP